MTKILASQLKVGNLWPEVQISLYQSRHGVTVGVSGV